MMKHGPNIPGSNIDGEVKVREEGLLLHQLFWILARIRLSRTRYGPPRMVGWGASTTGMDVSGSPCPAGKFSDFGGKPAGNQRFLVYGGLAFVRFVHQRVFVLTIDEHPWLTAQDAPSWINMVSIGLMNLINGLKHYYYPLLTDLTHVDSRW